MALMKMTIGLLVTAGLSAAILVAGCGGTQDAETTTPPTTTADAPAAGTEPPVAEESVATDPSDPLTDDGVASAETPTAEPSEDVGGDKSADELAQEGKTAAVAGEFDKAHQLCGAALEKQPDHQDAVMVCLISACNIKDESKAKQYFTVLTSKGRQQVGRQVCAKLGVTVD